VWSFLLYLPWGRDKGRFPGMVKRQMCPISCWTTSGCQSFSVLCFLLWARTPLRWKWLSNN
jgi:hypothetical protein